MSQILKDDAPSRPVDALLMSELQTAVDQRLESLFKTGPHESRLDCAIRHGLLSPGKRFRPIITLLACEQSGGKMTDALDGACAVEMVHAASLIMDDLPSMDDARLRRGSLATHMVFGEGTGLLASISLMNEAYRIISSTNDIDATRRLKAIDHLCSAIGPEGLSGGQERDIMCGRAGQSATDISLGEMEERHTEKTGALFAAAAAIGGEYAGASPEAISSLKDYGNSLGLAYQAFDDVVDSCCSTEDIGKDVAQDTDKATVVSLLGEEGARKSAKRWLDRAIAAAESDSLVSPSPLATLAVLVGEKFGSLTN